MEKNYIDDKIVKDVLTFCKKHNWRLGQFIWNAVNAAGGWESPEANTLFFMQDEDLELILTKCLKLWTSKK